VFTAPIAAADAATSVATAQPTTTKPPRNSRACCVCSY
jgi:hypothetical protein